MVRWGILGCGGIARRMAAVIPEARDARLVAAAARDKERAAAFAARFGADKAYGSYEELAADKEVDAVYVATIHPAHAAAVELCLRAGKAVLCEKPLTMSAREARRLFDLAEACGVPLLEAMWTRYLPAWRRARELVREGAIGELRSMQADFCFNSPYDPASRLYAPELGGRRPVGRGYLRLSRAYPYAGAGISLSAGGRPAGPRRGGQLRGADPALPGGCAGHDDLRRRSDGGSGGPPIRHGRLD